MPALNNASVVALQLESVAPDIPTLFDRDDVLWGKLEKRPVTQISSRDMRIPLELRAGGKFGMYDTNGGSLGRGSGQFFDKAVINAVNFKEALEWTKQSEWATDSSRKAVAKTVTKLLADSMDEFRRNIDSMCMTDGTGVMATGTTVSVGTGTGGGDVWNCTGDGFGARLVRFGQDIDVYNAALSVCRTPGAPRTINFWDLENKIFHTTPSLATLINTDKAVVSGAAGAAPPVSLYGVPYHHNSASTGTWLGFDRALTPEIRANRVAAGGALSLPFARLAINKIGNRVGIKNINRQGILAMMHPCQKQAYEELGQLVSIIQKGSKDEGLDLYFNDNMQIAGAPVDISYSWDRTRIDFLNTKVWGRAELHPAGFYDQDGRKMFELRSPDGGVSAAAIFYLVISFNLFVNNPAACSYIDTLAIPTGY